MKYVASGSVLPNTVALNPKFAQINTWSPDDYVNEGFIVQKITYKGRGPLLAGTTEVRYCTQEIIKGSNNRKLLTIDLFDRIYRETKPISITKNFVVIMKALVTKYPHFNFEVSTLILKDIKSGDILRFEGKGKKQNRRLILISFNNKPHYAMSIDEIAKAVGDLYFTSCFFKGGNATPAYMCNSALLATDDD